MTLLNELAGRTNEGWISKFISFGNACDVDELDAVKYYATEPTIQQIWSYLEGFHNGPAFINAVKEEAGSAHEGEPRRCRSQGVGVAFGFAGGERRGVRPASEERGTLLVLLHCRRA